MDLWIWIVIGVAAAIVLFALTAFGTTIARRSGRRRRRQEELQERFGPEYERVVAQDGRRGAEETLEQRLSTYAGAEHPALGPSERESHTAEWRLAQFRFVDSPERAVREAEHIVVSAMEEHGYPTDDASVRADALSVDDATLADAYRAAHRAFLLAERGDAAVDQLLGAFLVYREMLEFLLDRPQREETVYDTEPPSEDEAPSTATATPGRHGNRRLSRSRHPARLRQPSRRANHRRPVKCSRCEVAQRCVAEPTPCRALRASTIDGGPARVRVRLPRR